MPRVWGGIIDGDKEAMVFGTTDNVTAQEHIGITCS